MVERTAAKYGLTATTESSPAPEEAGWGSSRADTTGSSADGDTGDDPNQSAFISQATTKDGSTSTTQPETDSESGGDHGEISSLFGEPAASDGDPAPDQAAQPANGSTPV